MPKNSQPLLLMDAGNTRIKWRVVQHAVDGELRVLAQGATLNTLALDSMGALQADFEAQLQSVLANCRPQALLLCQVLGPEFEAQMQARCAQQGLDCWPLRVQNTPELCTDYTLPNKLGLDRWAAAWALTAQERMPLQVVVSFGTATTVDVVQKDGTTAAHRHRGGLILPGLQLMLSSLHKGTAQLPHAQADWSDCPTSTQQAIFSGVVWAQVGALNGFLNQLQSNHGQQPTLWVHGGNLEALWPYVLKHCHVFNPQPLPDAVFEGVLRAYQAEPHHGA